MTKFFKSIVGLVLFLGLCPLVHAASIADLTTTSTVDDGQKSFLEMYQDIVKEQNKLTKAEIDLKFLKEDFKNTAEKELTTKQTEKEILENELEKLRKDKERFAGIEDENNIFLENINKKEKELIEKIDFIELEIAKLKKRKNELELEHKTKINEKETQINEFRSNIEKNKEILKQDFTAFLIRLLFFGGTILVALFFSNIAKSTIKRHGKNLPIRRREVLFRVVNVFTYSIVGIIIFATLFAQFAVLLPFLALLGTGLAFAVRDVISSFLAWFFIGMRYGYKIGDLIEIGGARGRVKEISLIHTIIRETGERGPTGKILTIPNKMIFQEKMRNFSAMYRFTWIITDFLLERNSNIEKVRQILEEVIEENTAQDTEEIKKALPAMGAKFSLTEENTKPQIFVELTEYGILVKTKVFCRLEKRHTLKTAISQDFLSKIREEHDIVMRFLNYGSIGTSSH
ncbi:MAG: mechanosensitive ion channel [Candidatus Gracilibacteria bacterium]|jgi:small-conductance mechanosensitive channel|nr:mechanosensitive ion channel [Candidatus Gracilibacteria bacterium]